MNLLTARAITLNNLDDDQMGKLHLRENSVGRQLIPYEIRHMFRMIESDKKYHRSIGKIEHAVLSIHNVIRLQISEDADDLTLIHAVDRKIKAAGVDLSCDKENKRTSRARDESGD